MRNDTPISVRIRDITVRQSDAEEPEYHKGDLSILASLRQPALEALQVLKPMAVVRKRGAYQLVGGFATYRVLRAALGESADVRAIQLDSSQASLARALDLLVGPALEGAGPSNHVLRRWLGLSEESAQALNELGFDQLSRSAISHTLGTSRGQLYRAMPPTQQAEADDEELWSSLVYERWRVQAALRSVMEDASSLVGSVCSMPSMNLTPRSSLSSHS